MCVGAGQVFRQPERGVVAAPGRRHAAQHRERAGAGHRAAAAGRREAALRHAEVRRVLRGHRGHQRDIPTRADEQVAGAAAGGDGGPGTEIGQSVQPPQGAAALPHQQLRPRHVHPHRED